jgi:transcriptional regulator GlxA family with amidase domain
VFVDRSIAGARAIRVAGEEFRSTSASLTYSTRNSTGHAPIDYVQRLRVEEAKRRLERTHAPVDEISWKVGYEDPALFSAPIQADHGRDGGAYRRKFHIPEVEIV